MKNIVIPTTFEADTLEALKLAADLQRNSGGNIVLLTISELPDAITGLLFLGTEDSIDHVKRKGVWDAWLSYRKETAVPVINVREHHQYGLSRPVMSNLMEHLQTDMVIMPSSFQHSKQYIHRTAIKLFYRSSCPVMTLPAKVAVADAIHRALYLDVKGRTLTTTIQNLPYHIIHQSMVSAGQQPLHHLVDKMNINLIVQPKAPAGQYSDDDAVAALGLPVLTV